MKNTGRLSCSETIARRKFSSSAVTLCHINQAQDLHPAGFEMLDAAPRIVCFIGSSHLLGSGQAGMAD
jgi:hypothetical protein